MKAEMKERLFSIAQHAIPYVILIVAAFFSVFVLFYDGIPNGDDVSFHIPQIYDIYYGMKNGHFGISPNNYFMGGLAFYNEGYYGPVSHYSAAIIAYLTSWAGGGVIFGYKATLFLSSILGAVYMYKLARKISKNYYISLICAFIFVFLPYRSFCALSRGAYGESVAIAFIPMVFYGGYSILFDEFKVSSYVALSLGAIGIIMTHPFTGLFTAIFGIIFVFANFKQILLKRKDKVFWIALSITTALTIGGLLYYVVNALVLEHSDIYRFSDPLIQWTNIEHIQGETERSVDFSGFLNIGWIRNNVGGAYWDEYTTVSYLVFTFLMFIGSAIAMIFVDHFSKKLPWWGRFPIDLAVLVVLCLITDARVEQYLATSLFFVCFVLFEVIPIFTNDKIAEHDKNFVFRDPNFYFCVGSMILCLFLLFVPEIWEIMPHFLYKAQFPWRIWGFFYFLVAMLVAIVLTDFKVKKLSLSFVLIAASSIVMVSMGLAEKRMYLAVAEENSLWVMKDEEQVAQYTHNTLHSGWQNEMMPAIYYENYSSEYSNSLYYYIKNRIGGQNHDQIYIYVRIFDENSYVAPAVLEGDATIQITEYDCPNFTFHLNVASEEALIQFPQLYADGYYGYINDQKIACENVDGLVAFRIKQDEGTFQLMWKGPAHYRVLRPIFYSSIGLIIAGGVVGFVYRKKYLKSSQ